MEYLVKPVKFFRGEIGVASDKSISHRAVMFASIADGISEIDNFLTGEDCISTINCFKKLGVKIEQSDKKIIVYGNGMRGLKKPDDTLYVGNSGTTIRLISGVLAGQNFEVLIDGDDSIRKRPMNRIIEPLRAMGADISGEDNTGFAPIHIRGKKLKGTTYDLKIASAQVKSCIILAALYADSETKIIQKMATRDHTELMLNHMGANIKTENNLITIKPLENLSAGSIAVPGDISSAAFFIVGALITEGSFLTIKNVGINETRTGIITALKSMGANIKIVNKKLSAGEPVGDLEVKYSKLSGTVISGDIIPKMIDEIPIFAVAAVFAEGTTVIKDAEELKVKESNRIKTVCEEFSKLGADIKETEDGMIINGGSEIKGAPVDSHKDHRIAMSLSILGALAKGKTLIKDSEAVEVSFPGFFQLLESFL